MKKFRPTLTVAAGAALGLVAAAAVYGAVSTPGSGSPSPAAFTAPVTASPTSVTAPVPTCGAGLELEHGVCVAHVEPTITPAVAAPRAAAGQARPAGVPTSATSSARRVSGSGSTNRAAEVADDSGDDRPGTASDDPAGEDKADNDKADDEQADSGRDDSGHDDHSSDEAGELAGHDGSDDD